MCEAAAEAAILVIDSATVETTRTYPVPSTDFEGGFLPWGGVTAGYPVDFNASASIDVPSELQPAYWPATRGVRPVFVIDVNMSKLAWQSLLPSSSLLPSMQLGASTAINLAGGPSSLSEEITVETQPSTVTFLNVPPTTIRVNEPFLMKAQVCA